MAETRETILITGASGFLGQALTERLVERYRVVGLDLRKPARQIPGSESLEVDLTSDESIARALATAAREAGGRFASVLHLAAYYDLSGEPNPLYEKVTIGGTRRLLRALQRYEVEQFVFASTLLVHQPTEPGQPIDEDWPLAPAWPYPESKARTEQVVSDERGEIPAVLLRLAGVYDEQCRSAFLAQQIARIYEKQPLSYLFAGDATHGQASLHLQDMIEAMERVVDRRRHLPPRTTLLIGEPTAPSYETLQKRIGELLHGEPWPTWSLPKETARAGAWLQEEVLDQNNFIKPWMIDISDAHYELDISRARRLLGWEPHHRLLDTLPAMIEALKADPPGWYRTNKLNAAKVAAADPVLAKASRRVTEPSEAALEETGGWLRRQQRETLWTHLVNMTLGLWLLVSPFAYGLFDRAAAAPVPPALGHALPDAATRNAWLAASEMLSGLAVILLSILAIRRPGSLLPWLTSLVGLWIVFAPLVFWTTSAAAYNIDTLIGALVIAFAVMVPPTPGVSRAALASPGDLPLGWSYSPSIFTQRLPIVALSFVGFFVSRELAAFQLGHTDSVWEPFFGGGPTGAANGSEGVITSWVSKGFPIPDAGLGAVAYLLDILTGIIGDRRRWRTMPWMVVVFGLLIIPLGLVSVGFIMIQPTLIGTLCTLCLVQAVITVILIPYAVDEVWATGQYLIQAKRAGLPFWRTFFRGGPAMSEQHDPTPDLDQSFGKILHDFLIGGVSYSWQLCLCTALGAWLIVAPWLLGSAPALADSHHLAGCAAITIAVTALAEPARAFRFLLVPLGAWVAASPFLLGGADLANLAVALLSGGALLLFSLPRGRIAEEHYGGWDRYIV